MKTFVILITTLFISNALFAQAPAEYTLEIYGQVQADGKPVPFARIAVPGTSTGTSADENGKYRFFTHTRGNISIEVSALGYLSERKEITNDSETQEINFSLKEDLIGIDEVIVSANRYAEQKKYSSVIVNALDSRISEISGGTSVLESLNYSPGLRVEDNCQNCGFPQVRMNGMEGPYTQILVNSRPVYSGLTGVYGLDIFPSEMIDRIEVVRGGGSALYGGNAIAGTINLITKEPQENHFHLLTEMGITNLNGNEVSIDRNLDAHVSVVSDSRQSGILLYASKRDKDPTDVNGDGFSDRVKLNTLSFGFGSYYKPGERSKIGLDFYSLNDFRRGGNKFDQLPHNSDITEQVEHDITGANVTYDWYSKNYGSLSVYASGQYTNRQSYYGAEGDETAYGATSDLNSSVGAEYLQRFNFLYSKLLMGLDHKYGNLEDKKLGASGNPNTLISHQKMNVLGSFLQYEMKTAFLTTTAGLRFDNYWIEDMQTESKAVVGSVPVPRLSFLVDINTDLQFRAGYAAGYRSPQIYDEDLHIESSGARRITHINSSDLKQENSHSINSSFRYSNIFGSSFPVQTEIILEGFYTRLTNPFANEFSSVDENGNMEYVRVNANSGALVYGTNIELNLAFPSEIVFQASYTQQKSQYEKAQQWGEEAESVSTEFLKSPDSYGYLALSYLPKKGWSGSVNAVYTGRMLVPHFGLDPNTADASEQEAINKGWVITGEQLDEVSAFLNIGFELAYTHSFKGDFTIKAKAGIRNILDAQQEFDSSIYRDPGYIFGPSSGRTLSLGLEFSMH